MKIEIMNLFIQATTLMMMPGKKSSMLFQIFLFLFYKKTWYYDERDDEMRMKVVWSEFTTFYHNTTENEYRERRWKMKMKFISIPVKFFVSLRMIKKQQWQMKSSSIYFNSMLLSLLLCYMKWKLKPSDVKF